MLFHQTSSLTASDAFHLHGPFATLDFPPRLSEALPVDGTPFITTDFVISSQIYIHEYSATLDEFRLTKYVNRIGRRVAAR